MKSIFRKTIVIAGISAAALSLAACRGGRGHHSKHGDKMFEKMDTNTDGKITQPEFSTHSAERFAKMDVNNDGAITKEEVKEYYKAKKKDKKEKRQ